MTISYDLIYEILRRVPVKHLLRCRCVSKKWCSLIDSPEFVKIHHKASFECNNGGIIIPHNKNFYVADYESLHDDVTNVIKIGDPVKSLLSDAELVGYANGLVCFYQRCTKNILILNPSTRKCATVPMEPYELRVSFNYEYDFNIFRGGFGYDHVSDDYKVVKIGVRDRRFSDIMLIVYGLKTNSWTRIQDVRLSRDVNIMDRWGRFASGALYWMATDREGENSSIIVGFDLGLEQFREVSWNRNCRLSSKGLIDFGGKLYILNYNSTRVDVFQMNDYSAENPWSMAFSMQEDVLGGYTRRPLMYSESRKEVLVHIDCRSLVWYRHESERVKKIRIYGISRILDAQFYTESLFQFPEDRQKQKPSQETEVNKQQLKKRKKNN